MTFDAPDKKKPVEKIEKEENLLGKLSTIFLTRSFPF